MTIFRYSVSPPHLLPHSFEFLTSLLNKLCVHPRGERKVGGRAINEEKAGEAEGKKVVPKHAFTFIPLKSPLCMLNNAWPSLIPLPPSPSSSFISFIFLPLVPQVLITPPSRLTAGGNWDWQSRVMVAGHQGRTVKERERKQMSNLSSGEWSYYFIVSIDLSEWALKLDHFRGAWLGLNFEVRKKKHNKFCPGLNKACGVSNTPLDTLIVCLLVPETKLFQPHPKSACSCFIGAKMWHVSEDPEQTWCVVVLGISREEDLNKCHFNKMKWHHPLQALVSK